MIGRARRIASMAKQERGAAAATAAPGTGGGGDDLRERLGRGDWILEDGDPNPNTI